MAANWVSTQNGRHLSGRRSVNTAPEVALRKAIHARGGRFRLHRAIAKACTPDFVLPRQRVAVFVDGCFWHACPVHGHSKPWKGPNAALWTEKMRRTKQRDLRATRVAMELGWRVVRVWECQVQDDASRLAAVILDIGTQSGLTELDSSSRTGADPAHVGSYG
jgi:DNA mismatch endonuclease (patch repair protein)